MKYFVQSLYSVHTEIEYFKVTDKKWNTFYTSLLDKIILYLNQYYKKYEKSAENRFSIVHEIMEICKKIESISTSSCVCYYIQIYIILNKYENILKRLGLYGIVILTENQCFSIGEINDIVQLFTKLSDCKLLHETNETNLNIQNMFIECSKSNSMLYIKNH